MRLFVWVLEFRVLGLWGCWGFGVVDGVLGLGVRVNGLGLGSRVKGLGVFRSSGV